MSESKVVKALELAEHTADDSCLCETFKKAIPIARAQEKVVEAARVLCDAMQYLPANNLTSDQWSALDDTLEELDEVQK